MAEEVIGLLFGVEGVGVNGASGQIIVNGLTKIVNEINEGKSKVPKIKLQFDTTEASKAVTDLQKKLDSVRKNGSGVGGNVKKTLQAETAKFVEYQKLIKQWVKDSKTAAKLASEYPNVSLSSGGNIDGYVLGYKKNIVAINETAKLFSGLKSKFDAILSAGGLDKFGAENISKAASSLGVTEEQFKSLFNQIQTGSTQASLHIENANRKNAQSWTAMSSKVRDEVQRMYSTISKDPNVKKMADDIMKYSKSATGNVGELKNKYDELRNAIHKNGVDVETWGDKFKKTFAGKVRSALAAAITAAFTKYLREIYVNVVNIDKALVNLQIASGKSRAETKELIKEYSALAKQLGATTIEAAEAADTWLRQGYSAREANKLITNSTMLSKLGQMEAAEASRALTSAMKGYGVSVEESVRIVDKLTKVDMEAAASAGDIATAMAETATSAKLSGVSMDTLIGYLTVIKEVTQDSSESVGVFAKTLFARMNNVAAGKFIDDETGESLNDVETVLGDLGIALRSVNGEFRNSSDVLGDVAARWDEFNDTERNAIATAMAGTRNFEKFNVLMENYGTAMKYAKTATDSAGTATEKFGAYTEGIEGKMNSLKASFEELSMTILNSDLVASGVEFLQAIVGILSFGDGLVAKIAVITVGIIALEMATKALTVAFSRQKVIISAGFKDFLIYIGYVKAMATSNGISTAMVDAHTAAIVRQYTTGLTGIITFIPRAIAAIGMWAASNIAAKFASDGTTVSAIGLNAALQAMNVNPFVLAITAAIAVCAGLVAIVSAIDTAWEKTYQRAKEAAEEQQELIDGYDKEIDSLEALKTKLQDAQGNRQKLASIYDELNKKISISAGLIQGEAAAHAAAKKQIEDQIEATKRLREEATRTKIEQERAAFESQKGKRSGVFGWDWKVSDETGGLMRSYMTDKPLPDATTRFEKLYYDNAAPILGFLQKLGLSSDIDNSIKMASAFTMDYDRFYSLSQSEQENFVNSIGFTLEDWNAYWDNQVISAKSIFSEKINEATGTFGASFMDMVVDRLIRGGHDLDSVEEILNSLSAESSVLNGQLSEYYDAIAKGSPNAEGLYDSLMASFDALIAKYPELTNIITTVMASISGPDSVGKGATVQLKPMSDILEEVSAGYDGLVDVMSNVTSEGYLTADALSTLFNLEKEGALGGLELEKVLIKDANGYKLADDALQQYIQSMLAAYSVERAFATEQDKLNAIANLENFKRILATLISTEEDAADASKARREELEREQEAYENQLDKFDELIDLRKELLDTYKEELDYQKELEKRQRNVTALQTKLSVARLDQSAAGQARVRELEAELQEAQDELDDFTLEHAIDVLTDQLDNTNAEWKSIIQGKLNEITKLLDGLDTSPDVNVTTDMSWVPGVMQQIETLLANFHGGKVEDPDEGPKTRWTSYEDASAAGFGNILGASASERGRAARQYGSYQSYLDEMYERYMGKPPTYHFGGFVGDISTLSSNEEFAKLLKGEFVSTPSQMKRFMEETLPQIANYSTSGGTNEFNAPLIEITCESVTTESLPELERVVNDAVKEIKRQLDSGMSRTGYKRTPTKRLT